MTTSEWNIALNRENTELRVEVQRLKAELSRVSEEKDLEWRCEYCDAVYAEYINGCPKCFMGETGTASSVRLVPKTIHWTDDRGLSACGAITGRVTVREQDVTCEVCRKHHNLRK